MDRTVDSGSAGYAFESRRARAKFTQILYLVVNFSIPNECEGLRMVFKSVICSSILRDLRVVNFSIPNGCEGLRMAFKSVICLSMFRGLRVAEFSIPNGCEGVHC